MGGPNKHLSLLFSCPVMSSPLHPHGLQHARPPYPSPSPEVCPSSCPLNPWCHPAISSSDTFFSFCLNLSQHEGIFQWVNCSHQMIKILELQIHHQSFQRVSSVQLLSCVQLFANPWTTAHQASLCLTISRNLPKFMSIALVMPSSHLILWHPLLLLPSRISYTPIQNEF